MTTITFDTLAYSENMQKAGFTREQADAMAKANSEAFQNMVNTQQLATKYDVDLIKHDLEIALANTKHDILKLVIGMMIAQTILIITAFGIGIAILK